MILANRGVASQNGIKAAQVSTHRGKEREQSVKDLRIKWGLGGEKEGSEKQYKKRYGRGGVHCQPKHRRNQMFRGKMERAAERPWGGKEPRRPHHGAVAGKTL